MLPPFWKGATRCADLTSSRAICLVTSRRRPECRPTIRCAPSGRSSDAVLRRLSPRFERLYVKLGRPSIAPEKLLRALLLQELYTIRSERQLVEQLQYNLLFQWFVGLSLDDAVWDADDVHEES